MADNYTVISADTHAGASHSAYREYLDSAWHEEFDAWRGRYKNPYKDLGDKRRLRNWDNEMRNTTQLGEGVVGEVIFPNTVPPFFPSFVLFAQPPNPKNTPSGEPAFTPTTAGSRTSVTSSPNDELASVRSF